MQKLLALEENKYKIEEVEMYMDADLVCILQGSVLIRPHSTTTT